MLIRKIILLSTFLCLLVTGCSTLHHDQSTKLKNSTNWEMLYENDENGAKVTGSLENLVDAIKSGADMKILCTWTNNWDESMNTLYPERFGYVKKGALVYLVVHLRSVGEDSSGNPSLNKDLQASVLFRTDGVVEIIHYYGSDNRMTIPSTRNIKMKWFVKK